MLWRATSGKGLPSPFLKIEKRALILKKKGSDCDLLWIKFSIRNVVLRVPEKKPFFFFEEMFIEVL